jgi:hypothetical protein
MGARRILTNGFARAPVLWENRLVTGAVRARHDETIP